MKKFFNPQANKFQIKVSSFFKDDIFIKVFQQAINNEKKDY